MRSKRCWWFNNPYLWPTLTLPGPNPSQFGVTMSMEGDCIAEALWAIREGFIKEEFQ